MIGKTISHYRILEEIGRGGMGIVYKAQDTSLDRVVALKFLSGSGLESDEGKTRFLREARAAAALNHRNICTVYEIEETEDGPFIAMELVDGSGLDTKIKTGPLPLGEAVEISCQTIEALHEAHEGGITHRDIKPANIMTTSKSVVKIMDFGLAKAKGQTVLTREGSTLGTVSYMSPEQTSGAETDHRTDIWSIGIVLYEMVTGLKPFRGDYDQAVMYSVVNEQPKPLTAIRSGVPLELERIVLKAMSKEPEDRYQHADEMLVDLRKLQRLMADTEGGPPGTPDHGDSLARKSGNRRIAALALAAAFFAALVALVFLWNGVLKPYFFKQELIASPKPIAVISFENMTGDPDLDYLSRAIPNLLITDLEQSEYISVITWERMQDLLEQLGRDRSEKIDKETGFELCLLDGVEAVVVGSFTRAGNTFATELKVLDVDTKDLLKSASSRGDGVESILDRQIDELSMEISRGIGLSAKTINEKLRPIIDVTTSSMDAYNHYIMGTDEYSRYLYIDARRSLERAIAIDSTFATAYYYLARTHGRMRENTLRNRAMEKALHFSSKATDRERLRIEAQYADYIERDNEKQIRLLRELVEKYPKEKKAHSDLGWRLYYSLEFEKAIECFLAVVELSPESGLAMNALGFTYMKLKDHDKAYEYFMKYIDVNPDEPNPYDSMAQFYYETGRFEEAIEYSEKALAIQPRFYASTYLLITIYGILGDYDSALVWVERHMTATASTGALSGAYNWRAKINTLTGRFDQAKKDVLEAARLDMNTGWRIGILHSPLFNADILLATGSPDKARRKYDEWYEGLGENNAMSILYEILYKYRIGMIDLSNGDLEAARAAERELDRLERDEAFGSSMYPKEAKNWMTLFRGELSLREGKPDEALRIVEGKLESVTPEIGTFGVYMNSLPTDQDVAARAHLQKGDIEKAISEYEKLLSRGPASGDWRYLNPHYILRLARLYARAGRREDAVRAYERFLYIWRDADEGLPDPADARKELDLLKVAG